MEEKKGLQYSRISPKDLMEYNYIIAKSVIGEEAENLRHVQFKYQEEMFHKNLPFLFDGIEKVINNKMDEKFRKSYFINITKTSPIFLKEVVTGITNLQYPPNDEEFVDIINRAFLLASTLDGMVYG